jgi:hypothetical protein
MGFLSEAITSTDNIQFSSFTESVILATIFGRAVAHKQQASVEHVYLNVPQHFWDRHAWLDKMLSTRIGILQIANQSTPGRADCMLLFTKMVAQTTKLYLCKVIEAMCWETNEYQDTIAKYMHRAWMSSKEILKLSGSLTQLSSFKVRPRKLLLVSLV